MALVVARMMRFYHLSDRQCLDMPIKRFLLLSRKIGPLEAREQMQVVMSHHGDPKKQIEHLQKTLEDDGITTVHSGKPMEQLVGKPGVTYEPEDGFIQREFARRATAVPGTRPDGTVVVADARAGAGALPPLPRPPV